jgi:diaminopimelate decarboxylase
MTEPMSEERPARYGQILNRARHLGLVREEDTALLFHDLSLMDQRVEEIQSAFPRGALHAVSVKANPLPPLLKRLNRPGFGLEAASFPELHLALGAGVPPDRIVYDSPVKTLPEIASALERGVLLNADSLEEIRRIGSLLRDRSTRSRIGIRINPQVGAGRIGMTSTADDYSKFGVPLSDCRDRLKEAFAVHTWLEGVHLHIGSQGCPMDLLVRGVELVAAFALETNRHLESLGAPNRVRVVDIGGGLRVPYRKGEKMPDVAEYGRILATRCPHLFTGEFGLITEFGRYVHAGAGWAASRVEYVKHSAAGNTVLIHLGADMFLRRCYRPEEWHHEISLLDRNGKVKRGDTLPYNVAGPLCFSGDIIARELRLPSPEPGDYLVIHDAGAYTLSMWSRYNSREIPRVLGYERDGEAFTLLKEREEPEHLSDFWS